MASAYPGTPSTEILETIGAKYPDIKAGWAPNEKVAVEVAGGAALGGARALACMKHVGLNVAADPFMIYSYTGVYGGFVIVVCDDPEMHSSQNEQDTRNYAKFAKVPCIVPADSQEAKDMVGQALQISEQFDTPVLLLGSTRISHSMSLVEIGKRVEGEVELKLRKEPPKWVMLPGFARRRHPLVEQRLLNLKEFAETWSYNKVIMGDDSLGIISSGIVYQYAREALPEASFLKLGMVWPLPEKMIRDFASRVKRLIVIEDLDPFIEEACTIDGHQGGRQGTHRPVWRTLTRESGDCRQGRIFSKEHRPHRRGTANEAAQHVCGLSAQGHIQRFEESQGLCVR